MLICTCCSYLEEGDRRRENMASYDSARARDAAPPEVLSHQKAERLAKQGDEQFQKCEFSRLPYHDRTK